MPLCCPALLSSPSRARIWGHLLFSLCTRLGLGSGPPVPQQLQHLRGSSSFSLGFPKGLAPDTSSASSFSQSGKDTGQTPASRGKMAQGLYLLPGLQWGAAPSRPGPPPDAPPQLLGATRGPGPRLSSRALNSYRAWPGARWQVPGPQVLQQNLAGAEAVSHGGW